MRVVREILQQVYDAGDIYFSKYGGLYCTGCERFYTEKELVDGRCPDHRTTPEWIEEENYNVNPERAQSFYASIRRYWPGLPDNSLQPDYAGIRPKLTGAGEPAADFMIEGPAQHGLPGLTHLFGIESPGLTASLSLAEDVVGHLSS